MNQKLKVIPMVLLFVSCIFSAFGQTSPETFSDTTVTRTRAKIKQEVPRQKILLPESIACKFKAEGGDTTIRIKSDSLWTVIYQPQWITITGQDNNSLSLRCSPYEKETGRADSVTLVRGELQVSLYLAQKGIFLSLEENELYFSAEGGEKHVAAKGTHHRSTEMDTIASKWITAVSDNTGITVRCQPNDGMAERQGLVRVKSGPAERFLYVRQQAGRIFEVTPQQVEIPGNENTFIIRIRSNQEWEIQSKESWLEVTPKYNNLLMVTAQTNTSTTQREGRLVLTAGNLRRQVDIKQEGTVSLSVTPSKAQDVGKEGGVVELMVDCSDTWKLGYVPEWAQAEIDGNRIIVTCAPNETPYRRNFILQILATGVNKNVRIRQAKQEPVTDTLQVNP